VRGDFAPTAFLPLPGTGTPVMGPAANMSLFLVPSGSVLGSSSFSRW